MEISVRELKNHLSKYLRRAQAGEEIVVTSHGKAVATLAGVVKQGTAEESVEETARRLERMHWIIPAKKRGKPKGSDRPVEVPVGTTDEIMDWVRGR